MTPAAEKGTPPPVGVFRDSREYICTTLDRRQHVSPLNLLHPFACTPSWLYVSGANNVGATLRIATILLVVAEKTGYPRPKLAVVRETVDDTG